MKLEYQKCKGQKYMFLEYSVLENKFIEVVKGDPE